jgi:hypothetical protein
MFLRLRRGIVQPAGGTRSPLRFAGAPQARCVKGGDNLYEILLSNVLLLGALGFLLKLWLDKRLSHHLDILKDEYSHRLNSELEHFKSELAKDIARFNIREAWIHEKRMQLFSELYESILAIEVELKIFFMEYGVKDTEGIKARSEEFCQQYLKLNSMVFKNELYLESSLIDEIKYTYQPLFDFASRFIDAVEKSQLEELEIPRNLEEVMAMGEAPRRKLVGMFKKIAGLPA